MKRTRVADASEKLSWPHCDAIRALLAEAGMGAGSARRQEGSGR